MGEIGANHTAGIHTTKVCVRSEAVVVMTPMCHIQQRLPQDHRFHWNTQSKVRRKNDDGELQTKMA